ncbi:MAG TPA: UDP-glucose/GDP-mannose dehydrogenase family protein [Actinomycetota bacterium]|nr:UDP-glucose/GDP-mannose dehydrogenase family protein [Actinomycetota bacterium]
MKVAIVGTGYVGLVTGSCMADMGHDVICVDVVEEKVAKLRSGQIPIHEPGLPDIVERNLAAGRLSFTTSLAEAVRPAQFVFICVPTPPAEDGSADLSHVEKVATDVAPLISTYKIIVNKSTIPVGSSMRVERIVRERLAPGVETDVASNPEFLREGSAVFDFMHPDRIVIGTRSERAAGLLTELYRSLGAPLIVTDPETAEMIKYASNAFLATKISFINAISNICDAVGADVKEVALGMGYDARIGFEFLKPGPGFGGSCFPKDIKALIRVAEQNGYDFHLLRGVLDVNEQQHRIIANKVEKVTGGVSGKTIAAWGLAFKPNTDDVRDSPAIAVLRELMDRGATIRGYDPVVAESVYDQLGIERAPGPMEAADGADAVLLLTEWNEFRWLDFERLRDSMRAPAIVDARNLLDPHTLRQLGFSYEGVGR